MSIMHPFDTRRPLRNEASLDDALISHIPNQMRICHAHESSRIKVGSTTGLHDIHIGDVAS
jgi:hypothetical protein